MGRKRKQPDNIIQLDFFDSMLDCVTLGTKEIAVEQAGSWPPYAMVVSSRVWPRDPRAHEETVKHMERLALLQLSIYDNHPDEKYCLQCGEWRKKTRYTADERNRDGLHSWCNFCRAEHARKMYWYAKQGVALKAA